jgi:hypothetical protein
MVECNSALQKKINAVNLLVRPVRCIQNFLAKIGKYQKKEFYLSEEIIDPFNN